jgi:hypothetical protein
LYVLWDAKAVEGQTLNAVVFRSIIGHLGWGPPLVQNALLALVLAFEAGLLLVGAQTGFLDGPAVLFNMACDYWAPRHFRDLSARLVRQNGVIVMGVASLGILAVGEVDSQSYEGQEHLARLREAIETSMRYYTEYCHKNGFPAESLIAFGTDPGAEFIKLAEQTMERYPSSVCFASQLIFSRTNFLTAWLHNQTPLFIQRRLHLKGKQMVLLPMRVG